MAELNCQKELLNDLVELVKGNNNVCFDDIEKVYFTAHSLGGSATLILVYEMLKNEYMRDMLSEKNIDVVLFGAPKSGNTVFIDNLSNLLELHDNITIYRYNMKYDFIKYYPPVLMYAHICDDIVVHDDNLKIQEIVYNHSINCYIKHLQSYNLEITKKKTSF